MVNFANFQVKIKLYNKIKNNFKRCKKNINL